MRLNSVAAAFAVFFLGVASAQATTVTIPDPAPDSFILFDPATVTYGGVTFSSSSALGNGNFFNVGSLFSGSPAVLSSQQATIGVENILITFAQPVAFFSLHYGTFNGSGVTFALSNGDTFTQASTGSSYLVPDFVEATGSTKFASVLVMSSDDVLNLNNLVYSIDAVPEPSTWAMMLLGFVGIGFVVHRRKSRPALMASSIDLG